MKTARTRHCIRFSKQPQSCQARQQRTESALCISTACALPDYLSEDSSTGGKVNGDHAPGQAILTRNANDGTAAVVQWATSTLSKRRVSVPFASRLP